MNWRGATRGFSLDARGIVAIEFAAIALPLMLLLGGTIEVSRYIWTRLALQDAASTGARCLGLRTTSCFAAETMNRNDTVSVVRAQAADWAVRIPEEAVTPEMTGFCQGETGFARVGIRHRFVSIVPILPNMWIDVEACFPLMPPG